VVSPRQRRHRSTRTRQSECSEHHARRTRYADGATTGRDPVGDHVSWNCEAGAVRGRIHERAQRRRDVQRSRAPCHQGWSAVRDQKRQGEHIALHKGRAFRRLRDWSIGTTIWRN